MSGSQAFYERLDETTYRPTAATMSPWDERMQHGGPPSALAVHAVRRAFPRADMLIAQVCVNFLGPIPRADVQVRAWIERPGKRIELTRVRQSFDGRIALEASIWRIATRGNIPVPDAVRAREAQAPPLPPPGKHGTFAGMEDWGYGNAIEWRFTLGGFGALGPAGVWTRLRLPLVAGFETDALERLAAVADSANGISREFELDAVAFIPTAIVLTLDRTPAGEWMHLHSTTHVADEGVGFTSSTLSDQRGVIGTASQTLLLDPRVPLQGAPERPA